MKLRHWPLVIGGGITMAVVLLSTAATAQSRPFETTEQARQRHSAERYETYRKRGHQAPLGGYSEKLGDPAPLGTERPGYTSPKGGSNWNRGTNNLNR